MALTNVANAPTPVIRRLKFVESVGDLVFKWSTIFFASLIILAAVWIGWELLINSSLSLKKFGLNFLWRQVWDPVMEDFGALPFIYGTLVSSTIALLFAVPLGLGVAVFLYELAPPKIADAIGFLTELLAAIPSVVYGLIGVFVIVPWVRCSLEPFLSKYLGFIPLFKGAPYGVGMLTAGLILAIMILPFIATISREIFKTVPQSLKESAMALGATRWEVLRIVTIPFSKSGILGSIFLALGRALGETMAVTMVIGNRPEIKLSLFEPGYTMAAVIANEFTEATSSLYLSTLVEVGLVLFGITILVNGIARMMIYRSHRSAGLGARA